MPGQAVVLLNGKQWTVSVASTYAELVTGLSGEASILAGTGMLFDMGVDQSYIQIDMSRMLFPVDIIFINSTQGVVGVLQNVQPGEEVYFQATTTPGARYFLEVNAGEAEGIEVGDDVSITTYQLAAAFDLTTITSFAAPLVLIGFVSAMVGGVAGLIGGSSSPKQLTGAGSSPSIVVMPKIPEEAKGDILFVEYIRELVKLGETVTDEEAKLMWEAWKKRPGHSEITTEEWEFAEGMWESTRQLVQEKDPYGTHIWRILEHYYPGDREKQISVLGHMNEIYGKYGKGPIPSEELLKSAKKWGVERMVVKEMMYYFPGSEHQSMWLTLKQRKELEKKYGMVAVRWAEEATRPGDIKAAERAAEYYYRKVKEALGLGHLSPKLTEEQIKKLRELLGLTADVAEVLKIHQETGYIP